MKELKECDIVSLKRFESEGNLKAFVDIRVGGGLVIRGCTVMDGKNGIFAGMPRRLSRDGRWMDVVIPETEELRTSYQEAILRAYEEKLPETLLEDAPAE